MTAADKETIYIDVDDEITSIVEKVRNADHKIVALVLPKRMATLQSIVNMKLLKRTADESKKKVVLITSEASLLPLAGAVKLHVAKTLQSKPAIPPPPDVKQDKEVVTDDGEDVDKNKAVGELAGVAAVAAVAKDDIDEDTIDVDSVDDEPAPKSKAQKNKLKVPNFEKFRTKMFIIGGGLALLLIIFFILNKVLPKATVTIKTNSTEINVTTSFTANTDQKTLDVPGAVVPAQVEKANSTSEQKVPATGKKNVGAKATGEVTMSTTIQGCSSAAGSIPAGVTITNGVVSYTTGEAATFHVSDLQGGNCIWTSNNVSVTANDGGSKYNVGANTQFTITGYAGSATNGAAMSGGTDKTITIVTQADIDAAKQKANEDTGKVKSELSEKFKALNLYALPPTLQPGKQTVTSTPQIGQEASEVTVKFQTEYSMLGVKQDDLEALINEAAKDQLKEKNQKISDYGLDQANITISSTKSPTNQTMSLQTSATAGATINEDALVEQIKGKKGGDVKILISQMPGVEEVTVDFSPFWVNRIPSNPDKTTIVVEKQQASTDVEPSQ